MPHPKNPETAYIRETEERIIREKMLKSAVGSFAVDHQRGHRNPCGTGSRKEGTTQEGHCLRVR
jgi:hypothetical protein